MDVRSQRNCGRCDALDTGDSLASGHRSGIGFWICGSALDFAFQSRRNKRVKPKQARAEWEVTADATLDTLYTDHHVLAVDIANLQRGNFRTPHAVSSTVITRARCMRLPAALMSEATRPDSAGYCPCPD